MISKTIGFRGTNNFQTNPLVFLLSSVQSVGWWLYTGDFTSQFFLGDYNSDLKGNTYKPVFHGMKEGFISHCSIQFFLDEIFEGVEIW